MRRVTGIGGIFIKARDPVAMQAWYREHLGIDVQDWGGTAFRWVDADGKPTGGTTVWEHLQGGERVLCAEHGSVHGELPSRRSTCGSGRASRRRVPG
jgi:hypothetical protein